MGILIYSLLWVMQDSYHQPYVSRLSTRHLEEIGFLAASPAKAEIRAKAMGHADRHEARHLGTKRIPIKN